MLLPAHCGLVPELIDKARLGVELTAVTILTVLLALIAVLHGPEVICVIVNSVVPVVAKFEVVNEPLPAATTFILEVRPVAVFGDPKL